MIWRIAYQNKNSTKKKPSLNSSCVQMTSPLSFQMRFPNLRTWQADSSALVSLICSYVWLQSYAIADLPTLDELINCGWWKSPLLWLGQIAFRPHILPGKPWTDTRPYMTEERQNLWLCLRLVNRIVGDKTPRTLLQAVKVQPVSPAVPLSLAYSHFKNIVLSAIPPALAANSAALNGIFKSPKIGYGYLFEIYQTLIKFLEIKAHLPLIDTITSFYPCPVEQCNCKA